MKSIELPTSFVVDEEDEHSSVWDPELAVDIFLLLLLLLVVELRVTGLSRMLDETKT